MSSALVKLIALLAFFGAQPFPRLGHFLKESFGHAADDAEQPEDKVGGAIDASQRARRDIFQGFDGTKAPSSLGSYILAIS